MKVKEEVQYIHSPQPRWLIETAFGIMILSAALSPTPVTSYMESHCAWLKAVINTVGDVIFYWGLYRGMQTLYKPLRFGWLSIMGLVVAGFITTLLLSVPQIHATMEVANVAVAALLPLAYIPMGVALILYYRGALAYVGVWMIVRCVVANIMPVVWVLLSVPDHFLTLDILYPLTHIAYAYSMRRVLVPCAPKL